MQSEEKYSDNLIPPASFFKNVVIRIRRFNIGIHILCSLAFLKPDTITIGLLVQDKQSVAAIQGAELAILHANQSRTGLNGYFKIEVRNMEGPWGTGAKESVSLIFDDHVWVVIGSIDGRNSHLAEQVSAKTQIPYISASSGDPSLGQAFIPWFFSCVPNDLQLAEAITGEIEKRNISYPFVISDHYYDSEMAVSSLMRSSNGKISIPRILFYRDLKDEIDNISSRISSGDCVIFFGSSADLYLLLKKIPPSDSRTIFAPHLLMKEQVPENLPEFRNVIVPDPGLFFNNTDHPFTAAFLNAYGYMPGPLSAFAYDAVNIAIEGITRAEGETTSVYRHISTGSYNGITGVISFDRFGNRQVAPILIKFGK